MMGKRTSLFVTTALVGISVIAAPSAQAEGAAGRSQSGEAASVADPGAIIVTANRRSQNLQDVSLAVTAIAADDIKTRAIIDPRDIVRVAPGVVFDGVTSGNVSGFLAIRGIAQTDYSAHQESPNSVYLDEIYLSSNSMYAYPLYDVERLEVLRGPQGTLFGRASSGGLLSIIPAKPTKDFEGYAELSYGSYNERTAEGAIGGPLSDRVRFRLAGRAQYSDGWWKNHAVGGKDFDERKFFGLRGQLEADITDSLTARIAVTYNKAPQSREGTYRSVPYYVGAGGQPELLPANVDAYGTGPGNDIFGYRNPYGPRNGEFPNVGSYASDMFLSSLYLDWSIGKVDLKSITNYTRYSGTYIEGSDGLPFGAVRYGGDTHLKQFSQELRASATEGDIQWTAGVFYLHNYQFSPQIFAYPVFSGSAFAYDARDDVHQKYDSYAVFGQAEYKISSKLKFIAGLRLTHENKKFDSKLYFNELGTDVFDPPLLVYDFSPETFPKQAVAKETLWSGKIGLDFKPVENLLLYTSVSRGIKTAGFNANLSASLDENSTPYKSERVIAYEAGAKLSLLGNRVHLNTAIFYNDYSRFQGATFVGGLFRVANLDGRLYGGETELSARLPGELELSLSASYVDTKLYDVQTKYSGVRDTQFAQAPKWTATGSVSKSFEVGPGKLTLAWNGNFLDSRYVSIDNNFATHLPSRFEHNARISYNIESAGVDVAFWMNNISNQSQPISVAELGLGDLHYSYSRPRWYGVTLKKVF